MNSVGSSGGQRSVRDSSREEMMLHIPSSSFFLFSVSGMKHFHVSGVFLICFPVVDCNWRIYKDPPLEILIFFTVADVVKLLV